MWVYACVECHLMQTAMYDMLLVAYPSLPGNQVLCFASLQWHRRRGWARRRPPCTTICL
jgi:hypothetical protein